MDKLIFGQAPRGSLIPNGAKHVQEEELGGITEPTVYSCYIENVMTQHE